MGTLFVRVHVGEGPGQIPKQRIGRFVHAAKRRWPSLIIDTREFDSTTAEPWIGVRALSDNKSKIAFDETIDLEFRLQAYLNANQAPPFRLTHFVFDNLTFEELLEY